MWTTNAGIHFDNFLVGNSLNEALEFAGIFLLFGSSYGNAINYIRFFKSLATTFLPKSKVEEESEAMKENEKKKDAIERKMNEGGMLNFLEGKYMQLREVVLALDTRTLTAVVSMLGVALLSLLYLTLCATSSTSKQLKKKKNQEEDSTDEPAVDTNDEIKER